VSEIQACPAACPRPVAVRRGSRRSASRWTSWTIRSRLRSGDVLRGRKRLARERCRLARGGCVAEERDGAVSLARVRAAREEAGTYDAESADGRPPRREPIRFRPSGSLRAREVGSSFGRHTMTSGRTSPSESCVRAHELSSAVFTAAWSATIRSAIVRTSRCWEAHLDVAARAASCRRAGDLTYGVVVVETSGFGVEITPRALSGGGGGARGNAGSRC